MFDYLIVGAGFAGATIAERLAAHAGKSVLICDKRPHIGGNAYDYHDEAGVLVHKYGPHIFHTNSQEVFAYLSRFTEWRPYQHRVRASVDGQLVPIPINLDTINRLYGTNYTSFELEAFFAVGRRAGRASPSRPPKTSSSARSAASCTRSSSATTRASSGGSIRRSSTPGSRRGCRFAPTATTATSPTPIRSMPLHGYTRMFERMLQHPEHQDPAQRRLSRDQVADPASRIDLHRARSTSTSTTASGGCRTDRCGSSGRRATCAVAQSAPVINYPERSRSTRASPSSST